MQKSNHGQVTAVNRRKVQTSTTLSRKYTKRPAANPRTAAPVAKSPQVRRFNTPVGGEMLSAQVSKTARPASQPVQKHPMQSAANQRVAKRRLTAQKSTQRQTVQQMTAKELKEQAIQKALSSATKIQEPEPKAGVKQKAKKERTMRFGVGHILLAFSCAAAAVFAIVYFVNLNVPDISLKVAAMRTGIEPSYPNYVPRDYSVAGIASENERIILTFKNSSQNTTFTLTEEKSAWDTNSLLSNFVKEAYGDDYTVIREQGLTIYINGSNAAWVNGGMVYKIEAEAGVLSNKQISSIAVSL